MKVGSLGVHNCLGLARKKNACILIASTSEVYGDPDVHPQPEEYWGNVNPIGPRGVYDEAKRYLEALSMAYFRRWNLDVKIVRIFNTYGPKMRADDGRAIPNFINQALNNLDFTSIIQRFLILWAGPELQHLVPLTRGQCDSWHF